MAFVLMTYVPNDETKQGIGVAVDSGGLWYYVPYEIGVAVDPATWIVSNLTQIKADALISGALIDPAIVAAYLDDRGEDTSAIVSGVSDVVNLFPNRARRKVLWAIVRLMVNQINVLRGLHGLSPITYEQAIAAIVNEYKAL
jgi:hypothetical protein